MKLIQKSNFKDLNASVGLYQRDHDTTPFIVVGIDSDDRPMIECGFEGCNEIGLGMLLLSNAVRKLHMAGIR